MEIFSQRNECATVEIPALWNRLETAGGRWRRESSSSVAPENKLSQHGGGGGAGEALALLPPSGSGLEKRVDFDSLTSVPGRTTGSLRRQYGHHEAVSLGPGVWLRTLAQSWVVQGES